MPYSFSRRGPIPERPPAPNPGDEVIPPEIVGALCRASAQAIEDIQNGLPLLRKVLEETAPTATTPQLAEAAERDLMISLEVVDQLLKGAKEGHKELCTSPKGSIGTFGSSLEGTGDFKSIVEESHNSGKTRNDCRGLIFTLPFGHLARAMAVKEQVIHGLTDESNQRYIDMQAYMRQVKEHGLAGGAELQDPEKYWEQRLGKELQEARSEQMKREEEFARKWIP